MNRAPRLEIADRCVAAQNHKRDNALEASVGMRRLKDARAGQGSGRRKAALLIAAVGSALLVALLVNGTKALPREEPQLNTGEVKAPSDQGGASGTHKHEQRGVKRADIERALIDQMTTYRAAVADESIRLGGAPIPEDPPTQVREARVATADELATLDVMMDAQAGTRAAIPADANIMAGILNALRSGVTRTERFGLVHYYKDMARSMPVAESAPALAALGEAVGSAH